MKQATVFYQDETTRWTVIARDPDKQSFLIDTNEYVVEKDGHALMTDPGGSEVFPAVFAALAKSMDPQRLELLFASHQDPDIISSLALWLDYEPKLRCYVSWLWCGFIPHFGGDDHTLIPIPDEGTTISLGSGELELVPAHFLHSSGNFHLYDRHAKVLFSGDVGAALLPKDEHEIYVSDFDRHIRHAEGFHQRWMGSQEAKLDWCERAAALAPDFMCPQHGAIYRGADVMRFINWFAELPIGLRTFAKRA